MRTYSKRTRGSNQTFSIKRQRVDSSEVVLTSSSALPESSIPLESHSGSIPNGENSSSPPSSPSKLLPKDLQDSSPIKSRVSSPKSNRSNSPLVELESNQQNRRDNGIFPDTLPDFLNRKSSTKVKGDTLTSTKEVFSSSRRLTSDLSLQPRKITSNKKSLLSTPKKNSTKGGLASNHTSIGQDSQHQNQNKNTITITKEKFDTSLSSIVSKQDNLVTSQSNPVAKVKSSSILSYFKPLPQQPPPLPLLRRSSSHLDSGSSIFSDPIQQSVPSPSSSPPSIPEDPVVSTRSKPVRRRIRTKLNLPNISTMSDYYDNDMQELGGDFTDDSRIEMMERYHDAQDMRDHAIIDHGTLIPIAEQALDIPEKRRLEANLARPKPFQLTQQILDLGQSFHNKCQNCGMQYAINVPADQRMHDTFHNIFKMGGPAFKPKYVNTQVWTKVIEGEKHSIQCISCKESGVIRNLVECILKATLMDMDGTLPSSEQLWSSIASPNDPQDPIPVPRYKVFLYLIGARPIGILLAERIGKATVVLSALVSTENETETAPAAVPTPQDAYMCIDRLWVHTDFRRKGIATCLANLAREKFIPGLMIEKKESAVSLPTSVGGIFAEKYFAGVFEDAKFVVGL